MHSTSLRIRICIFFKFLDLNHIPWQVQRSLVYFTPKRCTTAIQNCRNRCRLTIFGCFDPMCPFNSSMIFIWRCTYPLFLCSPLHFLLSFFKFRVWMVGVDRSYSCYMVEYCCSLCVVAYSTHHSTTLGWQRPDLGSLWLVSGKRRGRGGTIVATRD